MPAAPSPDGLPSETDIARKLAHLLPPQVKDKFLCDKPLEIRPVEFHNPMKGHIAEPVRQSGCAPTAQSLTICVFISICWAMLQTLTSCRWRCSRTALVSLSPACRSPPSTTLCGSTGRLILTNGCFIASKAPRPPAPAAFVRGEFYTRGWHAGCLNGSGRGDAQPQRIKKPPGREAFRYQERMAFFIRRYRRFRHGC